MSDPARLAVSAALLLAPLTIAAPPAAAVPPIVGNITCQAGDADCNVCAPDVEGQFRAAFGDPGLDWSEKPWRFDWDRRYPPYDIQPTDDFASGVAHHIQGFIRTNSSQFPFAGTHDDDEGEAGVVFFVAQDRTGRKDLAALHRTTSRHPSGMQAIGKYVLVADGARLRIYDMNRVTLEQSAAMTRNMPRGFAAGGGLGVVKLSDASHLVLAYAPGGTDAGTRKMRFYNVRGGLVSGAVTLLDEDVYEQPAEWRGDWQYAENISAITECGTGRIYVISTEGDSSFGGEGYWLLSRVSLDDGGQIQFQPRSAKVMDQDSDSCWLRGSGTVHVAGGVMRFYCHQRKNIHWWYESDDRFMFEVGEP